MRKIGLLKGVQNRAAKDSDAIEKRDGSTVIRVRKQMLTMLRATLGSNGGGKNFAELLVHQLSLYAHGYAPFHVVPNESTLPFNRWKALLQTEEAKILAVRFRIHWIGRS